MSHLPHLPLNIQARVYCTNLMANLIDCWMTEKKMRASWIKGTQHNYHGRGHANSPVICLLSEG